MKKYSVFVRIAPLVFILLFSLSASAISPSDFGLKEGDLISAIFSDDPDVYIINEHGYKRLFLNPEIFKFYKHLGGFANVKLVTQEVRDSFPTTGLFRNCEDDDQRVFGIDVEGEDIGQLHWVNTSGEQAVKDDPDFFKKVFCINKKEFSWYKKADSFNSVVEVPKYDRIIETTTISTQAKLETKAELKQEGRVLVCHYPAESASKSLDIFIASSAVKAHLEHGDRIGSCIVSPIPSTSSGPTASPSATPLVTGSPAPTASISISLTPTPTSTTPATPVQPVSSTTPAPTPTPTTATAYAVCGQTVKNVPGNYSTIQAAINAANVGDTVKVAAGTYNENLTLKSGICLEGAGVDQTIISKSGVTGILIKQVSYAIIKNLTVKGSGNGDLQTGKDGGGIYINASNNIKVESCRLTQNTGYNGGGLEIKYGNNNITIDNCLIDNNSAYTSGGLGVDDQLVPTTVTANVIFNNLTVVNNRAGLYVGGVFSVNSGLTVSNSIFWGNSGPKFGGNTIPAGISSTDFAVTGKASNVRYSDVGGWFSGTTNISLDPQFISSTDYHLKSTSPAINTGDPSLTDSDGSRRDMGVYPYLSTPVSPTPIPTSTSTSTPTPTPTPTSQPQPTPTPTPSTTVNPSPTASVSYSPTPTPTIFAPPSSVTATLGADKILVTWSGTSLKSMLYRSVNGGGYQLWSTVDGFSYDENKLNLQSGFTYRYKIHSCGDIDFYNCSYSNGTESNSVTYSSSTPTPTPTLSPAACISDTDRSLNYGFKGSTTFTSGTYYDWDDYNNRVTIVTSGGTLYDTCVSKSGGVNLKEIYCDGDSRADVNPAWPSNAFIQISYVACSYGCNDGACNPDPVATITRNLTIGSTGNDVKQLQALLVNEVNYPADLITGYFGLITRDAVKRFQEKYGVRPISGYFGEITRRALNGFISD